jgi:hypothetical protein
MRANVKDLEKHTIQHFLGINLPLNALNYFCLCFNILKKILTFAAQFQKPITKKMKKALNIFIAIALVAVAIPACKKYEEGPAISLKTKTARLSRVWKTEKWEDKNGTTTTPPSTDKTTYEFTKENKFNISDGTTTYTGDWEFTSDKEGVITTFTYTFGNTTTTSKDTSNIIRLTSKELWFKDIDGDKTYMIAAE